MDPFTHGLVGAAAARVTSPSRRRIAACAGFVAALLADLDVLLQRPNDPLFQLELHRQFSHAVIFIPMGALLASLLLYLPFRKWLSVRALYLACFSGYATAGLLDACTSYGTQLLWPFSQTRFAWNLTPVVEPVVTLGLALLLVLSWRRGEVRWAWLALGWLFLLLGHGAYRQSQALVAAAQLWESRGHQVEKYVVKPTLGNQLLWRVVYIHKDRVYADAVRTRMFDQPVTRVGESAALVKVEELPTLEGTALHRALHRFAGLSDRYLVRHPARPNVIGDARYSMLPTSMVPLWGIGFDPTAPDEPVRFLTFRDSSEEVRKRYWDMLWGYSVKYQASILRPSASLVKRITCCWGRSPSAGISSYLPFQSHSLYEPLFQMTSPDPGS